MDLVGNRNLGRVLKELAFRYDEKIAIHFESAEGLEYAISFKELDKLTNRFANLLLAHNISKGDRVVVHMKNSIEAVISLIACVKIGAITVMLNQHAQDNDIDFALQKTSPQLILTQISYASLYENIVGRNDRYVIYTDLDKNEEYALLGIKDSLQDYSDELNLEYEINSSDVAEIMFTSGTTSNPKGVMITHYNLIYAGYYTSWQAMLNSNDIYLTVMPFCHIDGQCTALFPSLLSGATFVMLEKYSARKFWQQICKYKASITELMPKIIYTLLFQPQHESEVDHKLRMAFYYLDIDVEVMKKFCHRFNVPCILNSYGMTETIVGVIGDRLEESRRFPSIGRVGFGYEVKILNANGVECSPFEYGEICIKGEMGKTLFKGYYQDLEKTEKIVRDGWLHTGDIGYVDREGYFYFVDRNINLIKVSGENVSSVDLERFIGTFPQVCEVAVVGIDDELCGNLIKACIVPQKDCVINLEEVKKYCEEHLPKYKCPTFYEICTALPKSKSGKVKKYLLKNKCN